MLDQEPVVAATMTREPTHRLIGGYLTVAVIALGFAAYFVPFWALLVPGFAYATPLRRHKRIMVWLWSVAGAITLWAVYLLVGLNIGHSVVHDGPVHVVP